MRGRERASGINERGKEAQNGGRAGSRSDTPWMNGGSLFQDKVLGGAVMSMPRFIKKEVVEKVKIRFKNRNPRRSMVDFDAQLVEAMEVPSKDALVMKILGLF